MYDEEIYATIKKLEKTRRNKDEDYQLIYLRIRYYEPLIVTIVDTNELYMETGGVFELLYKPILLKIITKYSNVVPTDNIYKVIENMLKTENHVYMNDFDSDPDIINLKNGLYNIKGWKIPSGEKERVVNPLQLKGSNKSNDFLDSKPETIIHFIAHNQYNTAAGGKFSHYLSFIQIPIEYNKDAECLILDQCLTDIFGFEVVSDIYEMIGYFLIPTVKYQKAFILYGAAGSGKTTFIDMIIEFLGVINIEMINLNDLYKQFRRANLKSALLDIWDELESQKIHKTDVFKILVSNKYIGGNRKYIQKDAKWKNKIKLLFSTNFLPELPKTIGYEFFRRIVIIYCNNDFLKNDIRDLQILDKITRPKELSGLFNKAIEGWKRLEERKMFRPEFDDTDKVIWTWEMDRNPVAEFVDQECELGEDYYVEKDIFLDQCNKYRRSHGQEGLSMKMSTMCLKRLEVGTKQKYGKTKRPYVYEGIQLKNMPEQKKSLLNHLIDKKVIEY